MDQVLNFFLTRDFCLLLFWLHTILVNHFMKLATFFLMLDYQFIIFATV